MGVYNQDWFTAQASRKYPIDDSATGVADNGLILNDGVIVDLNLRWPAAIGQYAFIGSVTVTPHIVTVTILAANSQTIASTFTPIAAVSLPQPVAQHVNYPLTPLYPGVGGFIVFDNVTDLCALRFSTPAQTLLMPKVAQPYAPLPIPTIQKENRVDPLTGMILLKAGTDISIQSDIVHIDDIATPSIVISLNTASTTTSNVLEQYTGPCGVRPESGNCAIPGVQTINGIAPDCAGNINIVFRKLAAKPYADNGPGITVENSLGFGDVCATAGVNPFPGTDQCSASFSSIGQFGPSISSSISAAPTSSVYQNCQELPYTAVFSPASGDVGGSWKMVDGLIIPMPVTDAGATDVTLAAALLLPTNKGLLVWDDCGTGSSTNKKITFRFFYLPPNYPFAAHPKLVKETYAHDLFTNPAMPGVVLNYAPVAGNPKQYAYWTAYVDTRSNQLVIGRFNGAYFVTEATAKLPSGLVQTYIAYDIIVKITPSNGGITNNIQASIGPHGSSPLVTLTCPTNNYTVPDGKFGIITFSSGLLCNGWTIENV